MSKFFQYFPKVDYKFGDEAEFNLIQNIALYADVIDQVKNEKSAYTDYTVFENERPDQVSFKLYGTPNHHWTFYLLNDKLREQGWPLTNVNVLKKAKRDYPNIVLNTRSNLGSVKGFFKTGDTINGRTSGAAAKIIHRHMNLGQLVVNDITGGPFQNGELLEMNDTLDTIRITTVVDEYLSAHHYENVDKEYVDLGYDSAGAAIPGQLLEPGGLLTEITYLDRLHAENNNLKQIRVFKTDVIQQVVSAFREAVAS